MHGAQERRDVILKAALATLREFGFLGFTQPRVAKRAAVRQSHLTYYFPTRLALVEAVGRMAVDNLLKSLDSVIGLRSVPAATKAIAGLVVRHENTRVMMALAQAADEEPSLRRLFRELADGIALRLAKLLEHLGLVATQEHIYLIHAVSVGLAVVDLATQRPVSRRRAQAILESMFVLLSAKPKSR